MKKFSFLPLTPGVILFLAFMASQAHGQIPTHEQINALPTPAPKAGQKILDEIDLHIKARNLSRAEYLTDGILSISPENPNALFLKARIHFVRGELEVADALLFRLSLAYPKRVDLKIERARIASLLREDKAAQELWHSVLNSSHASPAQKRQARLALRQIHKNRPVSFGLAIGTLFRSNANNGIEAEALNIRPGLVLPVSPDMKPISGTAIRISPFFAWKKSLSEARATPSVRIFFDGRVNNISHNKDTLSDYNQSSSALAAGTEIEWTKNRMKLFYQTLKNTTGAGETRNTDLVNMAITHKRNVSSHDTGLALFDIKLGFGKQIYEQQKEGNARLRQIRAGSSFTISPESSFYLILGREDATANEESRSYVKNESGLLYQKNFSRLRNRLTFYQADISYGSSADTPARKDKSLYAELSLEHEALLLLDFPVRLSFAQHKNDSTSVLYQTKEDRIELSWHWAF